MSNWIILIIAIVLLPITAYVVSLALYVVIAALAVPYTLIKAIVVGIKQRSIIASYRLLFEWCYLSSMGLDQAGSPLLLHFGNDLCIKPGGKRFGSPDITLSHYFGYNKLKDTLYWFGLFWAYLIDLVALFFGDKDHTTKAANADQFNK